MPSLKCFLVVAVVCLALTCSTAIAASIHPSPITTSSSSSSSSSPPISTARSVSELFHTFKQQLNAASPESQLEAPATTAVQTQYGPVQGYTYLGVNTWRGIPFAAPPVGQLRWREPQDPANWTSTKSTILQANSCPQFKVADFIFLGNEDCLYLDVYVPANANMSAPLPVFVWIFGGGWVIGDSLEFGLYDGTNVAAARDYVIVAMNYRLGPLGFMTNDAMRADNPENTSNYGLLDQVKALRWVQNNIAAFGGDPTRVTIAGESAGAFSVCFHLASPLSKGLFHGAIMESGTCDSQNFFIGYDESRNWTNTYSQMVGCDPNQPDILQCLRNLPTGTILASSATTFKDHITNLHAAYDRVSSKEGNQWGFKPLLFPLMPWSATVDGVSLLDIPLNQIASGQYNDVPVIAGTNNAEGTIFVPTIPLIVPGTHFPSQPGDLALTMLYWYQGNQTIVEEVQAAYPIANYQNPTDQMDQILRDFMFICPSRRALRAMYQGGQSSVFLYHFDFRGSWIDELLFGDYHSSELEFVFDNAWPIFFHTFTQNDTIMANTFDTYWANFVYYQTPNGPGGNSTGQELFWDEWNPTDRQDMILAVPTSIETDYYDTQCAFWDSVDAINRNGGVPNNKKKQPEVVATPPHHKVVLV